MVVFIHCTVLCYFFFNFFLFLSPFISKLECFCFIYSIHLYIYIYAYIYTDLRKNCVAVCISMLEHCLTSQVLKTLTLTVWLSFFFGNTFIEGKVNEGAFIARLFFSYEFSF